MVPLLLSTDRSIHYNRRYVRIQVLLNWAQLMTIASIQVMVWNQDRGFPHTHLARTSISLMGRRQMVPWHSADNIPLALGQVHRAICPYDEKLASQWQNSDVDTNDSQPEDTS